MLEATVFYTLAVLILGLGILVISARSAVHSVLFLVVNFLLVAVLYVTLGAQFVAVIQVLVYTGGIVVLYLFVVMLVNLKGSPEAHEDPRRLARTGLLLSGAVLAEFAAIIVYSAARPSAGATVSDAGLSDVGGNVEQVGWMLYTNYLIPFEVASILLLVAMVGAIVLAKREL